MKTFTTVEIFNEKNIYGDTKFVLASEAKAEIDKAKQDWLERCKKFRKRDADKAAERERVLVEALGKITDEDRHDHGLIPISILSVAASALKQVKGGGNGK